jgi:AcrR family transcriptional regulator
MDDSSVEVNGRAYDNSRRVQHSQETRRRILDAATSLLVERGYRGTTIAAIAHAAEVHVDTVYRLVGRKPVLLRELIEQALSGTDRPIDAEERDYVVALRAESDPRQKLVIYARAVTSIHQRLAPLVAALREAASTEPEAAIVWRDVSDRRAANMRRFVRDVREAGGFREELTVELAADTIWLTNSAEAYLMLTEQRGWSAHRYERWLVDLWTRYLLTSADI